VSRTGIERHREGKDNSLLGFFKNRDGIRKLGKDKPWIKKKKKRI